MCSVLGIASIALGAGSLVPIPLFFWFVAGIAVSGPLGVSRLDYGCVLGFAVLSFPKNESACV